MQVLKNMAPLQSYGRLVLKLWISIIPPLTLVNICLCAEQNEDTQEQHGERFEHRRLNKLEGCSWGIDSPQLCALEI